MNSEELSYRERLSALDLPLLTYEREIKDIGFLSQVAARCLTSNVAIKQCCLRTG